MSPKDCKLRIELHTLTSSTWASVQQSTDAEVLNIWMDTPKLPALSVEDTDSNTLANQQDGQDSDTESLYKMTPTRTGMSLVFEEFRSVPLVRPFLAWIVLDDFGNQHQFSPEVKVNRFLSAIYHSLSATCMSQNSVPGPQVVLVPDLNQNTTNGQTLQIGQTTTASQSPQVGPTLQGEVPDQTGQISPPGQALLSAHTLTAGQTSQTGYSHQAIQVLPTQASRSGRPKISVIGRTSKDVDDLTYNLQQNTGGNDTIIEQTFRKETVKLFRYYVPRIYDETIAPVRLFWGLLYELIVSLL